MDPLLNDVPERFATERLEARLLRESDAAALLEAARESHAGLYEWYSGTLTKPDLDMAKTIAFIRQSLSDFYNRTFIHYGIFDRATGRLVGCGSLHHLDWAVPKARIGYWVRATAQGHGYATEVAHMLTRLSFEKLGVRRLEIRTATGNPASGKVAHKLGYKFVAVFEKNKAGNGGVIWDLEIHARFDTQGLPDLNVNWNSA